MLIASFDSDDILMAGCIEEVMKTGILKKTSIETVEELLEKIGGHDQLTQMENELMREHLANNPTDTDEQALDLVCQYEAQSPDEVVEYVLGCLKEKFYLEYVIEIVGKGTKWVNVRTWHGKMNVYEVIE